MSIDRVFVVVVTMIITGGMLLCVAFLFIQDKQIARLKSELVATETSLEAVQEHNNAENLRPEITELSTLIEIRDILKQRSAGDE